MICESNDSVFFLPSFNLIYACVRLTFTAFKQAKAASEARAKKIADMEAARKQKLEEEQKRKDEIQKKAEEAAAQKAKLAAQRFREVGI